MAFVGKVKMNPGHPFAHTQISFGGNVRQARTTRQRASGTGTVYHQSEPRSGSGSGDERPANVGSR